MTRTIRWLLGGSFFLSGGTALIYQVLWSRQLQYIFGSTTEAVSAVLATFMAGLGLGAYLLAPRIDRASSPLKFYALLEIGIGLYGVLSVWLLQLAGAAFVQLSGDPGETTLWPAILKVLLSALVLLPPCFLMGGTLPALLRAVSDTARVAQRWVGVFYAVNLIGAVAGTLATGFVLLERIGLSNTARLAGLINLAIGVVIMLAARRLGAEPPAPPEAADADKWKGLKALATSKTGLYALLGLLISGGSVMAYEIIFTRVLGLVFGVSAYAFTVVLATFLLGLGLGAAIYERWAARHRVRAVQFAWSQIGVAAVGGLALVLLPSVPRLVLYLRQIPGLGFWEILAGKAALAVVLLLPLAVIAGLGVPILVGSLVEDLKRLARTVGDAYLVNTIGTVAGSLLTGFALIGAFGTEGTLRLILALNALTGLIGVILLGRPRRTSLVGAGAAVAVALLALTASPWPQTLFLNSDTDGGHTISTSRLQLEERLRSVPHELLFFREGRNATITIAQTPRIRSLLVNGHPDGSDSRKDMATQVMLAVIPMSIHPRPGDVLVIGYGTGVTAHSATRFEETASVDVLEIEPAIVEASPFFHHVNGKVEENPKTRVILDDARSYVAATSRQYDVVVSEPSNPWRAGVANLYSREFFTGVRDLLRPGGIFAQWMHLYFIHDDDLKVVLKTLSVVFPEIQVWWLDEGNVVILAAEEPLSVDRKRVDHLLDGRFRNERIHYANVATTPEFYSRMLLGRAEVDGFLSPDDAIHSDDHPLLEFRAPRGLVQADGQNALRLLAAKVAKPTLFPRIAGPPPSSAAGWLGVANMYSALEAWEEARLAIGQALSSATSQQAAIRAAELELAGGNPQGAARLLQPITQVASIDVARELAYAQAHFFASQYNLEAAREAFTRTGELAGRAGVELLDLLVTMQEYEAALDLSEQLLAEARFAGPVGKPEVEQIYIKLFQLAASPELANRAVDLAERLPDPGLDFPRHLRFKLLAVLYERLNRPQKALDACEEVERIGVLDFPVMGVHVRALKALGRNEEAAALEARLHQLAPSTAVEPVLSPLLSRSQEVQRATS